METGAITSHMDVAQVTLYAFWAFFAILIWYLRQEDRREGYPLEADVTGAYNKDPWLFIPRPKTFVLPHGHGTVSVPSAARDARPIAGERTSAFSGASLRPNEGALGAGIGPGAWAERADRVDETAHGSAKIVPLRADPAFSIAPGDPDPRGMDVIGCDRRVAGVVSDVWVDRSEYLIRYLEVMPEGEDAVPVLLPMNFCVLRTGRGAVKHVYVHAITADQFPGVPAITSPDQVTMLEEEKIVAYYGGGLLYATPGRQETLL